MKIKNFFAFLCAVTAVLPSLAQASFDTQQPFGFVLMSSRTDASSTFNFTGGGTFANDGSVASTITLTSTGAAMNTAISNAIKKYSVIIFDGSKGDFILSSYLSFSSLSGKTLIGINNARICTQWYVTDEITALLDEQDVKSASTSSGTGGTLSNGTKVDEEAEYKTRQILLTKYGNENYRKSGCFAFSGCRNIAIRNIKFVGPGSIDVGGYDLLAFSGCNNMWVDHCDFTDGIDGNFDITNKSNFCTVSWCTFSYTDRSYMHQNTNLVGSSDSEATGYLNITFAYNVWGQKCRARMPMARVGKIHMLNNYYNCAGNATACINPRKNSEFLIEGNYFEKDVEKVFSQSGAVAYDWKASNIIANDTIYAPESMGSVTVPYTYDVQDAGVLPEVLSANSGATLTWASSGIAAVATDERDADDKQYNIFGQRIGSSEKGIHIKAGKKYIVR